MEVISKTLIINLTNKLWIIISMCIHIFTEIGLKLVFSLYGLRIRKTRDKKKINNDERNNSEMRNQLSVEKEMKMCEQIIVTH